MEIVSRVGIEKMNLCNEQSLKNAHKNDDDYDDVYVKILLLQKISWPE